ncbi:hypothetical protein GCM10023321_81610 [Pseudonocardia eucalypti]|uniref:HTH cro/C1-type domain-containing protein n=1 Tax=Pseudonocardia eucalypti TaxID=648755 RepID=A0ABP9RF05_9PSEU|nr:transcriptional regulator with XRE-family HTH domain [Pseudonocardia eucalypti]
MLAALGVRLRTYRNERGWTLHELGRRTGYSAQHLGAVERAAVVPSESMIAACDAALLTNGQLIVMLAAVIREQAHIRSHNLRTRRAASADQPAPHTGPANPGGESGVDWERLADAGRRSSRISEAVVDDLEQITDRQRHLYHELSSTEMLTHVQAHLALLTTLLRNHQEGRLRRRLGSAAGEAAGFAAWLWFDLGDPVSSGHSYAHATDAVGEAGDQGLSCYINGYQGLVAAQLGHPDRALTHLSEAIDTIPRSLSPTTRSWLTILRADALARTARPAAARKAIHQAREWLTQPRPDGADPWMYEFDEGSLAAHAGNCHLTLNQPRDAIADFREALDRLPSSCDRRKARIQIGMAHAHLACGDAQEALRLGGAALDTFARRGSAAGLGAARALRDAFAQAGVHAAARALDDQAHAIHHDR